MPRAEQDQVWKPRWYAAPFVPGAVTRVRVDYIEDSQIDGKPHAAHCVSDSGTRIEIALNRHGALGGFKYVGMAEDAAR